MADRERSGARAALICALGALCPGLGQSQQPSWCQQNAPFGLAQVGSGACSTVIAAFQHQLPGRVVGENGAELIQELRRQGFEVRAVRTSLGSLENVVVIDAPGVATSASRIRLLQKALQELGSRYEAPLRYLEVSRPFEFHDAPPNDQSYAQSVGSLPPQQPVYASLNVPQAWERIKRIRTDTIVVAVADTGIAAHPDLNSALWSGSPSGTTPAHGKNFSGAVPDDDTDDTAGHGTHVAGLIGAASNNCKGIASIAWNGVAAAQSCPVSDAAPSAPRLKIQLAVAKYAGCTDELINALDYAANTVQAPVINMSASQALCSDALRDELATKFPAGTLLVTAVDNVSKNLDDPNQSDYPASYLLPNVIAVGMSGVLSGHEYFAGGAYGTNAVQIDAPGMNLATTDLGNGYTSSLGTSDAAPLVSATVALMKSFAPAWTIDDVRGYLIDSATKATCPAGALTSLCGKSQSNGTLNVDAALSPPIVVDTPASTRKPSWTRGAAHTVRWHSAFPTTRCGTLEFYLSTAAADDSLIGATDPSIDQDTWVPLATSAPVGTNATTASVTVPATFPLSQMNSSTHKPDTWGVLAARCSGTRIETWTQPIRIK